MNDFFSFYAFFEIVCFLLLLNFIKNAFKKYGLASLKAGIAHAELFLKGLKKDHSELEKVYQIKMNETAEQERFAKELLKRIKKWKEAEALKTKTLIRQRSECQERIKQYTENQQEWLMVSKIEKEVIPKAFVQAKKELIEAFRNKQDQTQFLDKVVADFVKGQR
jgi:thiamine pyrophosphate-dependent acetolactate synthase large subunit-like protein